MKVYQVLDRIKVLLDADTVPPRTKNSHCMVFRHDDVFGYYIIFDGSGFINSSLDDELCHDSYTNELIYYPDLKRYKGIVVPENDKIEMFNFLIGNNLSTENIETFRRLLKIYHT